MRVDVALQFAVLGAGTGGLYSLAALGLVLTYRASGILNFGQGAIGMTGAMVFYDLWKNYDLPEIPSLLIGIGFGALLGIASHLLIMRPLRRASPLTRLIATLGILVALEYGLAARYGIDLRIAQPILPSSALLYPLPGIPIPVDRLVLLGIAAFLTVILAAVYRYSRFGLRTAAVAQNPQAVAALGQSSDLIAAANWGIGGGLAATAAILVAPIIGLDVSQLTLLVIPAIATALIGGFSSFTLTFISGVAIGVIESEVTLYSQVPGLAESVPFVAIILIMAVSGRAIPIRGELAARLPTLSAGNVHLRKLLPVVGLLIGAIVLLPVAWVDAVTVSLLLAVVLLSLVVLTGFAGQLSLAQYVLAGIGAWIAGTLIAFNHIPFELAFLIGILGTVAVGIVIGLLALRTRGVNLAVLTLGLGLMIQDMFLRNPAVTGGVDGVNIGITRLFGFDIDSVAHPQVYAIFVFGVLLVLLLMVANLRRSHVGLWLIAIRTNERAAAALGINVFAMKLYAFGLAAGIAGAGGVLIAFRFPQIDFAQFSVLASLNAVVQAVIGGIGYITGPLFGSLLASGGVGFEPFAGFDNLQPILMMTSGILLVFMVIFNPNGLGETHSISRLIPFLRLQHPNEVRSGSAASPIIKRVPPADLSVTDLSVRFGGVRALERVSLKVGPGEIVGLIGPNGAGKTTLIDAVTGFVAPSEGDIAINGRSIIKRSAYRRARDGVMRSFQSLELFEDMTVLDNLRAASGGIALVRYMTDLVWPRQKALSVTAQAAVREFDLKGSLDRLPNELPYGQRRLVAIARAVAARPSILLLDEPAAGLDGSERAELVDLIKRLAREWGIAVLLVEHDVELVLRTCDRVIVLDFGRCLAQGTPAEVRRDPAVIAAYLGQDERGEDAMLNEHGMEKDRFTGRTERSSPLLLEARGLSAGFGSLPAVRDLNIEIHSSEVVALLGANGSGKTTTLLTLAGVLSPLDGLVLWGGKPTRAPPHRRARMGIGLVTEGRSVFAKLSVSENLLIGRGDPKFALDLFPELVPLLKRRAGLLSGGEQQILTLARALGEKPKLLLADEFLLGLAPLAVRRLLTAVRDAARDGTGVLLVEQHAHIALRNCDRAYVLQQGNLVLEGQAIELEKKLPEIQRSYLLS